MATAQQRIICSQRAARVAASIDSEDDIDLASLSIRLVNQAQLPSAAIEVSGEDRIGECRRLIGVAPRRTSIWLMTFPGCANMIAPMRSVLRQYLPMTMKDFVWSLVGGRGSHFSRQFYFRSRRLFTWIATPTVRGRKWSSALGYDGIWAMLAGTLKQEWKGVPTLKHPYELVLYPDLLWQAKPQTIIEIGSFSGGSAIWMADVMKVLGLPCQIISLDIEVPRPPNVPTNVKFIEGDVSRLGKTLTPEFLDSLPRPLLVIEDSNHMYEHTLAALRFFADVLRPGEYIVVEDATTLLMGDDARFNGGPARAITQFLETDNRYEIDAGYRDRFGYNVTGNPNGYLRRTN
jgi:cephalosporin hydroxylase